MPIYHSWPIRPSKLFYNTDERKKLEKLSHDISATKENLDAIFSDGHLKGWLYELVERFEKKICILTNESELLNERNKYNAHPPMVIIQRGSDSRLQKIELELFYDELGLLCAPSRKAEKSNCFNHDMRCNECINLCCSHVDDPIAELFLGKTDIELKAVSREQCLETFQKIIKLNHINDNKPEDLFVKYTPIDSENPERIYLVYICPRTRLIEIALPIVVKGTVLGVLITGQFVEEGKESEIKKRLIAMYNTSHATKNTDEYKEAEKRLEKILPEKALPMDTISKTIADFLANEVFEQQQCLEDRVERNIHGLIFEMRSKFDQKFNEAFRDTSTFSDAKAAEKIIKILEPYFNCELPDVLFVDKRKRMEKDWQFTLYRNGETVVQIPIVSLKEEEVKKHDCLEGELKDQSTFCLSSTVATFPYALKSLDSSAGRLLVHYHDNNPFLGFWVQDTKHNFHNNELRQMMEILSGISSVVVSRWLYAETNRQKNETDLALKSIGHELGQHNLKLGTYLKMLYKLWMEMEEKVNANPFLKEKFQKSFNHDTMKKFVQYYQAVESFSENIAVLADSAKLRAFVKPSIKTDFLIFDRTLFRLRKCFYYDALTNNMDLSIPENINSRDLLRPAVYGNEKFIEIAVFNYINNALKYGYRGTKIFIDCIKNPGMDEPHRLFVENCGEYIQPEFRKTIFDMGTRLDPAKTSGEGFGLYLVKQLISFHSGEVYCECDEEPLTKFNIAMIRGGIEFLKTTRDKWKDNSLLEELIANDEQLTANGLYLKHVKSHIGFIKGKDSPSTFIKNLSQPTYIIRFSATIPPKHMQD